MQLFYLCRNIKEKTMRPLIDYLSLIKVTHQTETADEKAPNGLTWIEFWKEKKGNKSYLAGDVKCLSCGQIKSCKEFVGAHVVDDKGNSYICPTCDICNKTYKGSKAASHSFRVMKSLLLSYPTQTCKEK